MINEEQLARNKEAFIKLLSSVDRPGIPELISYLESNGFFTAPASTQYHCSFPGGLCMHSLNVYEALSELVSSFESHLELNPNWIPDLGEEQEEPQYVRRPSYHKDSIIILGLLHDLYKMNFYEKTLLNKPIYDEATDKLNWIKTHGYKVKDIENRTIIGSNNFTSYYLISGFIPLTEEEAAAIINQFNLTDKVQDTEIGTLFTRNHLAALLHSADLISTYCLEHPLQNE